MVSFFTVNLLINISTFYYNKIIGEDMGNILRHVFDDERLPEYKGRIFTKLEETVHKIHEGAKHKDHEVVDSEHNSSDDSDTEIEKNTQRYTCLDKISFNFYVFTRGIYASLIFYFIPYMYLFVSYFETLKKVQQVQHVSWNVY